MASSDNHTFYSTLVAFTLKRMGQKLLGQSIFYLKLPVVSIERKVSRSTFTTLPNATACERTNNIQASHRHVKKMVARGDRHDSHPIMAAIIGGGQLLTVTLDPRRCLATNSLRKKKRKKKKITQEFLVSVL